MQALSCTQEALEQNQRCIKRTGIVTTVVLYGKLRIHLIQLCITYTPLHTVHSCDSSETTLFKKESTTRQEPEIVQILDHNQDLANRYQHDLRVGTTILPILTTLL